jgi:hypothetical protein
MMRILDWQCTGEDLVVPATRGTSTIRATIPEPHPTNLDQNGKLERHHTRRLADSLTSRSPCRRPSHHHNPTVADASGS